MRGALALVLALSARVASAAAVQGTVVDDRGIPQAEAWVILHPPGTAEELIAAPLPGRVSTGPLMQMSNASGAVAFPDVTAGRYTARAYERRHNSGLIVARDARVEVDVPARGKAIFRVAFARSPAIRGKVLGPAGEPVTGASIGAAQAAQGDAEREALLREQEKAFTAALPNPRMREQMMKGLRMQQRQLQALEAQRKPGIAEYAERARGAVLATTGADGSFEVAGLMPMHYALVAFKTGLAQREVVLAKPDAEVTLKLAATGSLVGKVFDPDGKPAQMFEVIRRDGPSAHFQNGAFDLTVDADGEWVLRISGFRTAPAIRTVKVFKDRVVTLPDVRLPAGRTVTVTVKGFTSDGSSYCTGRLLVNDGYRATPAELDARYDGAYTTARFENVPDLPGELRMHCPGFLPLEREVSAKQTSLAWVLERGTSLVGRLVDDKGKPWTGLTLFVSQSAKGGDTTQWATTDASGNFRLSGLRAGPATLTFEDPLTSHRSPEPVQKRKDGPLLPNPRELILPAKAEVRVDGTFAVAATQ